MFVYEIGDYTKGYNLRKVERPDPVPGHGEVVMKVRATGVNARDLSIMAGKLGPDTMPFTRVPLSDNAGEVLSIGPGVTKFKPGDRVVMTHYWQWLDGAWNESMRKEDFGAARDGFLAEQVVVPEAPLIHLPDEIGFEAASTLQSPGLTAWNAVVECGRAKPSDTVVTIGSGAVSVFGLQWAKMLGARVIVTSSSDEKLARLKALGADDGINYRTNPNWSEAVMDLTGGRGADIVLNNVGPSELNQCLLSAASGGRVMFIGFNAVAHGAAAAAAPPPQSLAALGKLIIRDLTLRGVIVGSRRMFVDLLAAMTRNKIEPVIDRVFEFDEINEAIAYMKSGEKLGKVVIRVQ